MLMVNFLENRKSVRDYFIKQVLFVFVLIISGSPVTSWCLITFFFFFGHIARHAGDPRPGIESMPSAVEAWCFNHWVTKKSKCWLLKALCCQKCLFTKYFFLIYQLLKINNCRFIPFNKWKTQNNYCCK